MYAQSFYCKVITPPPHVMLALIITSTGPPPLQVYLPLLLEYFSEAELRQLTLQVLELHKLPTSEPAEEEEEEEEKEEEPQTPSLLTLPPELLLQVLSYLSPRDLLRLAPLHSALCRLTQDPSLWQHLHPVRWAVGHWEFFRPPPTGSQVSHLQPLDSKPWVHVTGFSCCLGAGV